jgi:tRNA-specific 2-thiouridylase
MNNKALVAMSGGVDSSVAAYLALERGFCCAGVTMKLFNGEAGGGSAKSCCSLSDVNDARDVAYRLKIPHYVLNFKERFETDVISKFIRVYEEGGTPNPCIDCNRYLKFNMLLLRARELDFDFLVTGHYVRIEKQNNRYLLLKARDLKKDQSYVLYMLNQEQLARIIFPLGDLNKNEVRSIAHRQNFITADKKDSQDICFVPDGDYGAFIERRLQKKYPCGDILDINGNVIGSHKGFIRYTKGQRRGLGVSNKGPLYVCDKSPLNNTITLGSEAMLYTKHLIVNDINLIAEDSITAPIHVSVKTRYMQKEKAAVVEQIDNGKLRIEFDFPEKAVTPGQAAVLYDGDVVIGGGTIV